MIKQIKLLSLVALAIMTACVNNNQKASPQIDVLEFVDPFIGTGFHGHTFPGAVVPHGRVQISPDTHMFGWEASSGYHYADTTLYGFSHTHLSGTGIGDLGDILFLPYSGEFKGEKPVGSFTHKDEEASPGYYKVMVQPWDIKAELSATERTAWHKYTYPSNSDASLLIDLAHVLQADWGHQVLEGEMQVVDDYTVVGYRKTKGWGEDDPIWFKCIFDQPIKAYQFDVDKKEEKKSSVSGKDVRLFISFGDQINSLNAKVAVSSVDALGASKNLAELKDLSKLEEVVEQAKAQWRKELDVINIETKDKSVLVNFYTALYHSKVAPMIFTDIDGRYRGMDKAIHQSNGEGRYTIYSLWDVFRSWYPLMTIIEPERAREWAYDLVDHAEKGGLLPKWALNANYTGTMVGYPSNAILADAWSKGLIDSVPEKVLQAAINASSWQEDFNAKKEGRSKNVMTKHIYYKETLGFVPQDSISSSVSYGLEMAYYDWCVAQMAALKGDDKIAETYTEKGKAYRKYFDAEKGFMRGVNADGSRSKDFDPRFSDHAKSVFVEGNSYQWTPFVPHAIEDFREMLGGQAQLGTWLDSLFTTSSVIVGENASADITGLIGQYAHGNEPSHHVPFMYQYSDRQFRTQEILDTVLYHFYTPTPEGIIGNEDCGQMSAWYVLNAIGIYQITPGNPEMVIGRPIIDKATIKLKNGSFTIKVQNNSKQNRYVQSVTLNGKELDNNRFSFEALKPGGVLEIFMQNKK
ncbi:glycoside hydrolase family 92 protein [Puteibacter caeruleilacunae]|nr:glycoside hydrolase family 92 protein [Puteibacter caeruleilacunae]